MLLTIVLCWVGERASLPAGEAHKDPSVERSRTDALPLGKPARRGTAGQAAQGESGNELDELDEFDELGIDALLARAATLELAVALVLRQFDCAHEPSDWRARSSIGARGPPIV